MIEKLSERATGKVADILGEHGAVMSFEPGGYDLPLNEESRTASRVINDLVSQSSVIDLIRLIQRGVEFKLEPNKDRVLLSVFRDRGREREDLWSTAYRLIRGAIELSAHPDFRATLHDVAAGMGRA